ncbi:MAG: helix-turn-helix transcriptional regulator [Deltaproteobacteria bacterium]|nr:helix-turn-helix transcriptional regulator [Deltaproteobacteria bacterium]
MGKLIARRDRKPRADELGVPDRPRPRLKARKRPPGSDRQVPREIAVFDPENVEKVLDALPPREDVSRAADRLAGLGNASRLEALIALSTTELCVGDMSAVLSLSMSATSTMLKQLRSLGLIASRHAGKQIYYRLANERAAELVELAFALDEPGPSRP